MEDNILFVSGIDTGIGKTVVTGKIAREWLNNGINVITQKLIQTGCEGISEDILTHRALMGVDLFKEDQEGITCPYVFSYPCSPHLAAAMENVVIDVERINECTRKLASKFSKVLIEGAGGLLVPIRKGYTTLDFIQEMKYPLILVTSPKLGSINHTLLSLEVCLRRGIKLKALVYNNYPEGSKEILNDSKEVFKNYLEENFPGARFWEMSCLEQDYNVCLEQDYND